VLSDDERPFVIYADDEAGAADGAPDGAAAAREAAAAGRR